MPESNDFIYGMNPAFEVILAGRRDIFRAYLDRNAAQKPRCRKLQHLLEERNIPIELLEKGRLIHICGNREHQGVVLETAPYPYTPLEELLKFPRLVMPDNVEDPHNLGAILRSADVLGFSGALIPNKGVPTINGTVVKTSAGASEHLPLSRSRAANQYMRAAREAGFKIIALDGAGDTDLASVKPEADDKILLVIGGEGRGVRQYILNEADIVVRIVQQGHVNSLNASVAASLAMYILR